MPATTAQQGQEVRQRLLHAATELIAEQGWSAVSTRVLAQRAGVTPGVVHYHFASINALLTEAAMGVLRELVEAFGVYFQRAQTPAEGLDVMLSSLDSYSGRDPTSILAIETYLAATRDENIREEINAIVDDLRNSLTEWLAAHGVEAATETAVVLAAALDGVMLHRALDPSMTAERVAPILRRVLVLASRESPPTGTEKDQ